MQIFTKTNNLHNIPSNNLYLLYDFTFSIANKAPNQCKYGAAAYCTRQEPVFNCLLADVITALQHHGFAGRRTNPDEICNKLNICEVYMINII